MASNLAKYANASYVEQNQKHTPHTLILMSFAIVVGFLVLVISITGHTSGTDLVTPLSITFAINMLLGIAFFITETIRRPFSIMQIHWAFYLTFFVVAPLSQLLNRFNVWNYQLNQNDCINANLLLMLWGLVYGLSSSMVKRKKYQSYEGFANRLYAELPYVSSRSTILLVILSVASTMATIRLVGFENLFARSTFHTGLEQTRGLLFDKTIRLVPVFAFSLVYVRCIQMRKLSLFLVPLCICLLLTDFPFGMARFNAAMIYGGFALLAIPALMEKRGLFPSLFLLAVLVLFPVFNVFRWTAVDFNLFWKSIFTVFGSMPTGFCAGDYDAYSMLIRTVHYIQEHGITMGRQLIGVIGFFVPRTLWISKPVGSGAMIAASQGQVFTNVSCPLPAEGIVNFGVAGLICFALIFGSISARIDEYFYNAGSSNGIRLFYPFICMLFFFVMRGDLLSGWAFTAGPLITFLLLYKIVTLA